MQKLISWAVVVLCAVVSSDAQGVDQTSKKEADKFFTEVYNRYGQLSENVRCVSADGAEEGMELLLPLRLDRFGFCLYIGRARESGLVTVYILLFEGSPQQKGKKYSPTDEIERGRPVLSRTYVGNEASNFLDRMDVQAFVDLVAEAKKRNWRPVSELTDDELNDGELYEKLPDGSLRLLEKGKGKRDDDK